jgi:hypothetical protein
LPGFEALWYSDQSSGNDGMVFWSEGRMGISEKLLTILACPICKTPVRLTADNSGLKCETCKRVYPIRDDIPVMLAEEGKIEEEK